MTNPEHVAKLKEGVEAWNNWRKENRGIVPLLEGTIITGMNLQGINFNLANLEGAVLENTDFSGATLNYARLQGARLMYANLETTSIHGADLSRCGVQGVKFDNNMKCRAANVAECYGSQSFVRHVMDLDYIEETKEKHPWKYWLWKLTSNCGRSIGQWAFISLLVALIFGTIFANYPVWNWLPDGLKYLLTTVAPKMNYSNQMVADGWFTPYYFSIVTFTTLGFGDVTPTNTVGQIWLALEVVLGYIMLGGLITLFATKMVRQSG